MARTLERAKTHLYILDKRNIQPALKCFTGLSTLRRDSEMKASITRPELHMTHRQMIHHLNNVKVTVTSCDKHNIK
ncbi:hypothetical protein B7P43_G14092 [Cryptotermes secundus]|uniref:Uncharacterized protein n=1 Tax=Cryptotermes secundus TaxID=105785 RepID=A0A2J7QIY1_9NEOP|nr:hypothetical protein B7P43_G14092 [Cryptotermes secundus]